MAQLLLNPPCRGWKEDLPLPNDPLLILQGSLPLIENHFINALDLHLKYWPDKQDESGWASLIVREDKLPIR